MSYQLDLRTGRLVRTDVWSQQRPLKWSSTPLVENDYFPSKMLDLDVGLQGIVV